VLFSKLDFHFQSGRCDFFLVTFLTPFQIFEKQTPPLKEKSIFKSMLEKGNVICGRTIECESIFSFPARQKPGLHVVLCTYAKAHF